MELTIALAQIKTKLGVIEANLQKHLELAEQAYTQGADLIVFPELSLTGYALLDLASTVTHHPHKNDPVFYQLLEASRKLDIVVGFVDEDPRHRFYIAAAYLSQGEVVHIHHKVYLPTYGLFDEGRFFAEGSEIRAFDTRFGKIGMLICEDFWHASLPYLLWMDGADILVFTSASPGRGLTAKPALESALWVEQINQAYASLFTSFVIHTNKTGFEDGLNFWGGSTIFDPDGKLIVKSPLHKEALTVVTIDTSQLHRSRARLPLLRDERKEIVFHTLSRIINKD